MTLQYFVFNTVVFFIGTALTVIQYHPLLIERYGLWPQLLVDLILSITYLTGVYGAGTIV